jgi:hypothetical protein
MELLGDVGHVESCFGPFVGNVSVGARWVHLMVLLGDEAQVHTHFGLFGDNPDLDAS